MIESERLFIDIDFRSEFEVARSTGAYKCVLQLLPDIFVGKSDRLGQIISIISEAAKLSLKKKGMHIPPWRKAEYMRAKWLSSPYSRTKQPPLSSQKTDVITEDECGELELIFGEKSSVGVEADNGGELTVVTASPTWQLPAVKPRSVEKGTKVVTGLASLLKEKSPN